MTLPQLLLTRMNDRHTGLLPSTAANYLDAARVCLDRHQMLKFDGTARVKWLRYIITKAIYLLLPYCVGVSSKIDYER